MSPPAPIQLCAVSPAAAKPERSLDYTWLHSLAGRCILCGFISAETEALREVTPLGSQALDLSPRFLICKMEVI